MADGTNSSVAPRAGCSGREARVFEGFVEGALEVWLAVNVRGRVKTGHRGARSCRPVNGLVSRWLCPVAGC